MTEKLPAGRPMKVVLACALSFLIPLAAAEKPADTDPAESSATAAPANTSSSSEMEQLKRMLLDQQRQIDELRRALAERKPSDTSLAEGNPATPAHPSTGEVASTRPVVPPAPSPSPTPSPVWAFNPPALPPPAPQAGAAEASSPLQFKLGDAYFTPVGFMDMTSVTRSTNPGTGIGTNFGSIPYSNVQLGSLSESRLSPQNSRIGMRIDAPVGDMKVMGYWESDFLGQTGNPPNGGLAVSSNPYVFRMRLYWVNVTKGKFDFLAGQSWSMMTPNRKGISPLPGDIFYSQDIDVNYQLGLVWGRIPGFRGVFHPNSKVAFGLALENSEPYIGGGNGGSAVTVPAAFGSAANLIGTQVNNGSSVISSAALHPDIIAKLAFDPSSKLHFEIAGVEITNKVSNPTTTPAFQTTTKAGGGGSVNFSFEVVKGVRILTNNFYSAGAGRYIFGQAPDFMIRANGDLSLIRSGSTVTGIEATVGKTLYYGYYGGVYIWKNLALDNNKSLIGYGPISSDGQNRAIQEVTFGTNTTLVRDTKWGALNLMFQYSYLQRNPWLVTGTAPTNANLSMGFVNLRYTLPGAPPALK
jgi:hypothetical protein